MFEKLPPKILVTESNEVAKATICNTLERHWFSVERADSTDVALSIFQANQPNFVVLSSKFGSKKVLEFVKYTRAMASGSTKNVPTLILLDEGEKEDDFAAAKDDFVQFMNRPFVPSEFLSTIKALLRKYNPVFQDKIIKYKDLTMDLATYKVNRDGKNIHLGPTEFKIMQMLIQQPRVILSRQQIIDCVWGTNQNIEPRTVDVHVNRLRSLIKLRDDEVPFIKTVRAAGYCLNLPGERE